MKYINKKTGVILETESELRGAWKEYDPSRQPQEEKIEDTVDMEEIEEEKNNEGPEEFKDLTVAEIKQELDAFGVEYPKNAKKDELLKIMEDMKE